MPCSYKLQTRNGSVGAGCFFFPPYLQGFTINCAEQYAPGDVKFQFDRMAI